MPTIVLSYRRNDTRWITAHICEHLETHFGSGNVFMDIDRIPIGHDFREHIRRTLESCDILIAIIGPHWLETDAAGKSRLENKSDWVRLEIGTALERDIPVVPLLIDNASMPKTEELPGDLHGLEFRQAATFNSSDFKSQIQKLINSLDRLIAVVPPKPAPPAPGLAFSGVAFAAADARKSGLPPLLPRRPALSGPASAGPDLKNTTARVPPAPWNKWIFRTWMTGLLFWPLLIWSLEGPRKNDDTVALLIAVSFTWLVVGLGAGIARYKAHLSSSITPPR
jgi:hypothetical protein